MLLNSRDGAPLPYGLALIALPFVVIVGAVSGPWTALILVCMAAGLAGVGSVMLEGVVAPLDDHDRAVLSLPVGYMAAACLFGLGARSGIGVERLFWGVSVLALICVGRTFTRFRARPIGRLQDLWWLGLVSLLIAAVFFLPGAIRDGVYLKDGSYNWMYVDTQYFSAIASSVKSSLGVPMLPDMGIVDLRYHFGPHAIAGALSAALNVPVGDAVARVVRPAGVLSLVLAGYSLGAFLSREAGGDRKGGILAVAGLCFYGSVAALFSTYGEGPNVPHPILGSLPLLSVGSNGAPFAHLMIGGSMVPGLVGLFVLLRVVLAKLTSADSNDLKPDFAALWPAIVFPSGLVAGAGVLGLQTALFAWFGRRRKDVWMGLVFMVGAAVFAAWRMGYVGSAMTSNTHFYPRLLLAEPDRFLAAIVWVFVGLGMRSYVLGRVRNPFRHPVSAALLISVCGFASVSLFFRDRVVNETRYGFLYAGSVLSIFAFAWLYAPLKQAFEGNWAGLRLVVTDALRVAILVSAVCLVAAVLVRVLGGNSDPSFQYRLKNVLRASGAVFVLASASRLLMARFDRARSALTVLILAGYALGFAAWIPDWENFGLDRMKMDMTASRGEVVGLATLHRLSNKGDLIATNHCCVPGWGESAYQYGALSERTMLLQGWREGGAANHPLFAGVKQANDLLFSTKDTAAFRGIVERFHLRFIVAEPGTDIQLAKPLPSWLVAIPDSGTLTIYKVAM